MSEEIKKIKDKLEIIIRNDFDYLLRTHDCKILLDYITNLQEKVEQLENIKKEAIEYIKENSKSYSLPNTIKDMRYIDFYKLLDILNKGE